MLFFKPIDVIAKLHRRHKMPKLKTPTRTRFKVRVFYHIGINQDYTAEMPIIAHHMDSIPLQYAKETERLITVNIQKLLGSFNNVFNIGVFRLAFNCKREAALHKGKHIPHRRDKMLALIKRRITRMIEKIRRAILAFFALAHKNLVHISRNMERLLESMKSIHPHIEIESQL